MATEAERSVLSFGAPDAPQEVLRSVADVGGEQVLLTEVVVR